MRITRSLGLLLLAAFLAPSLLLAQDWRGKARVDGWVKDKDGQPVANASVELTRQSGGKFTAKTNAKGYWAVLGLAGGAWNVDVSAQGFETRRTSVSLEEGSRIPSMDIRLEKAAAPAPAAEAASVPNKAAEEVRHDVEEGNRLLGEKKYGEAREQYEKALAVVPDNTALLRGVAQTYHGEGNQDKAIETLKKIQQLEPGNTENQALLGSMLLEQGKLDEGRAMLDQLPAGAIKDPQVYLNLGILLINKKQPEQAATYFGKAIEIDPSQADAYYYRGLANLSAKKNPDAKADFKKYLELKPDGPEAKEVRDLLGTLK
ncbi:MAG TPA: tetratricopeptide repeat protein [Thermoanaerobaculia bacterium]